MIRTLDTARVWRAINKWEAGLKRPPARLSVRIRFRREVEAVMPNVINWRRVWYVHNKWLERMSFSPASERRVINAEVKQQIKDYNKRAMGADTDVKPKFPLRRLWTQFDIWHEGYIRVGAKVTRAQNLTATMLHAVKVCIDTLSPPGHEKRAALAKRDLNPILALGYVSPTRLRWLVNGVVSKHYNTGLVPRAVPVTVTMREDLATPITVSVQGITTRLRLEPLLRQDALIAAVYIEELEAALGGTPFPFQEQ